MWDRTLIESKGFGRASKRWWTVPLAGGLHAALIFIAIFASYWHIEAIEAPLQKMEYVRAIPVVIGPPPELGGGRTQPVKNNTRSEETPELTQPTQISPLPRETKVSLDQFGPGENTGTDPNAPTGPGTPDGIPGGYRDGTGTGTSITGPTSDEEPRYISVGVKEPILIKRVEPQYPRAALQERIQGMVVLQAVITKTGSVEQVKTLRADHAVLEKAATDTVLQWKYKPATVNNRPVKVYFTVTVTFRLK